MTDPKIQFIADNLQESLDVEVKNWLNGLSSNSDKAKLAKEMIALANHGGGYVFIGYQDDKTDLPELSPESGELEAFSQDSVSGIVKKYLTPPCHCRVEIVKPEGSEIHHPVIVVPGEHRTPVFAKSGGPNDEVIPGRVYVRRPGGASEEPQNQDDWEKLIDRLVRARQDELLSAVREILNPSDRQVEEETPSLDDWHELNHVRWKELVESFDSDDPRRLESGYWMLSFEIDQFSDPRLAALNEKLERNMPKYSGWPPFTYLHHDPIRPVADGQEVYAYIGHVAEGEAPEQRVEHCDYWRVSTEGKGFLLRPMQEDSPNYRSNITPRGTGPFFDWTIPVWRVIEILKFIEALAQEFGNEDSEFKLKLEFIRASGRHLSQSSYRYNLMEGATNQSDVLSSNVHAPIVEIGRNLEELTLSILTPIFEQFEFTKIPELLVANVVKEVLGNRRD